MAKRLSLREFQEDLVARLTSAARGEAPRSLLGIQAGNEHWLVDLYDSGEVVPLPPLTGVPLTRHWFSGVTNIRGTLYGIVDFSAFQGGEPTPRNNDARLLLIGARHGSNSALLVTRTLGLKALDTLEALPPGELPADPRPWIEGHFRDAQNQTWTLLNVRQLLVDPDFLEIGL
jgi:twitching motility protein PilI